MRNITDELKSFLRTLKYLNTYKLHLALFLFNSYITYSVKLPKYSAIATESVSMEIL